MGWQDQPVVQQASGGWQNQPVVQDAPQASSDSIGGPWGSVLDYFNLQKQAQPPEQQSVGAQVLEGGGKLARGLVPHSLEEARQMAQLPMPSADAQKQLADDEQLGAAWRGEYGIPQQVASIGGSALQAAPLLHLPFAESPLRPSLSDLNLAEQMRQAQAPDADAAVRESMAPQATEAPAQAQEGAYSAPEAAGRVEGAQPEAADDTRFQPLTSPSQVVESNLGGSVASQGGQVSEAIPTTPSTPSSQSPSTVRLYRVEPNEKGDSGDWLQPHLTEGEWNKFVNERGRAFAEAPRPEYGHGAEGYTTYYVDVPKDVAQSVSRTNTASGVPFPEYLLPQEYVAQKQPLQQEPAAATIPPVSKLDQMREAALSTLLTPAERARAQKLIKAEESRSSIPPPNEPAPRPNPEQVATFDEYAASKGVSSTPPSFPELHRAPGGVSTPTARAASARVLNAMDEWQNQRDTLQREYDAKVASGEIRPPGRIEKLRQTAQGQGQSAEAAKRLLAKLEQAPDELQTSEAEAGQRDTVPAEPAAVGGQDQPQAGAQAGRSPVEISPEDSRYAGVAEAPIRQGINNEAFDQAYGKGEVEPGTGKGADEWRNIGDNRLANWIRNGDAADDPYAALSKARTRGAAPASDVALMAAEHRRLLNDAAIAQESGVPDWQQKNQQAYDLAQGIQQVKGMPSDAFRAMQESTKPQFDSVADFDAQVRNSRGGEGLNPQEQALFQPMAKEIAKGTKLSSDKLDSALDSASKALPKAKKISLEDANKNISDQIEQLTKPCKL